MSAIMFHGVDEMYVDLLVVLGRFPVFSFVDKGVVFVNLVEFKLRTVLPLGVLVILVDLHGLCVVLRYEVAVHVLGLLSPRLKFSLISDSNHALLCLRQGADVAKTPSRSVQEVVLTSVDGDGNWVSIPYAGLVLCV